MKIVALLENAITAGGGFNQSLNAIMQMKVIAENNFDFIVLTSKVENLDMLRRLGITASVFKPSIVDKIVAFFATNELMRRIQEKVQMIGPLEKKMISMGCDLVYFVAPTSRMISLQKLNYVATVWDNCHREFPEFPEVRSFGEFQRRECIYKNYISAAYLTLVDSEQLKGRIKSRYGIDDERLIVMPFSPNILLDSSEDAENVLDHYGLEAGYFFYPAQFWAHKNHICILKALCHLRAKGRTINVVFVGGNHGNLKQVQSVVKNLKLESQVFILGFVPSSHVKGLYESCAAVVVPTYFGPTNLPPLEAWLFKKPLLYSSHLSEQVQDAALLFDPDNAESLASVMVRVLDKEVATDLIQKGNIRLESIGTVRNDAEKKVLGLLNIFKIRSECWSNFG